MYQRKRPARYLLQELPRTLVEFDPLTGTGRFARSTFRVRRESGLVKLNAELDVDLPTGERWLGSVELEGRSFDLGHDAQALKHDAERPCDWSHTWCPQTAHARGEADLRTASDRYRVSGSGYFDSNMGTVPLHDQGIARWDWGRVAFPRATLVFYWARAEEKERSAFCKTFLVGPDGKAEELEVHLERREVRISPYFVGTARELRFRSARGDYGVWLRAPLERGPFYERYWAEGLSPGGDRGCGFTEVVLPPRLDRAFMRPFIRMRTHSLVRPNSIWLPLFSGGPGNGAARLLSSWGRRMSHD